MSAGKFRVIVWRAGKMADPQLLKFSFNSCEDALDWAETTMESTQSAMKSMGRPTGYTIVVEVLEDGLAGPAAPPAKDPPNGRWSQ